MTSAPSRKCNGTFPWRHPDDRTEIAGGAGGNRADRCRVAAAQSAGRARSTRATSQRAPRLALPAYRRIFGWQAAGALPIPPRSSKTAPCRRRARPPYITNIDCSLPTRRWSSICSQDLMARFSPPPPLYRRLFEGSGLPQDEVT